jgi:transcriptional regulator GlxA family with amidase domain
VGGRYRRDPGAPAPTTRSSAAIGDNSAVQIDIVVYDGVDELDALGPLEVLRRAAAAGAELTARLVTRQPQDVVRGAWGLRFEPDAVYAPGADVILVPGGGWLSRADAGAWGEVQRGDWVALLAAARATTRCMAAVCTGTMLLAHAGLVKGRRAATHRQAVEHLRAAGAIVVDDRVVDDGDLVTSGGVTSAIDLALWLIEREFSTRLADEVALRIEYDRQSPATGQLGGPGHVRDRSAGTSPL